MSGKKTEQVIYEAYNHEKLELLHHLITNDPALGSAMIYLCRKDEVHALTNKLAVAGLHVDSIHGQKKPEARLVALEEHVAGKLDYLVVTEACARNMDISGVKTIINVDFPELIKDYENQVLCPSMERVFSFANPKGNKLLKSLEELIEVDFPRATGTRRAMVQIRFSSHDRSMTCDIWEYLPAGISMVPPLFSIGS